MPLIDADDVTWQNRAACAGADITAFVPAHETERGLDDALRHCDPCPVRAECLMWAMLHRAEGFWGGTSTYQRAQLIRVRTRAKCPLCLATQLVYTDPHELCLACGISWVRDVREAPIAAVRLRVTGAGTAIDSQSEVERWLERSLDKLNKRRSKVHSTDA